MYCAFIMDTFKLPRLISTILKSNFILSEIGPVLFPAKKYPNGQFYVEDGSEQLKPIAIPDFLTDETSSVVQQECLGVFGDSSDPEKFVLQVVNCSEKSLVFYTSNKTEQVTNIGLPVLPCYTPPSENIQINAPNRKKRSLG